MNEITSAYIHFPFCQHLCNYCDFYKHKLENVEQIVDFESKLDMHFKLHKDFLKTKNARLGPLETLYIGGGTPSLWKISGIEYLKQKIDLKTFELSSNCEFTIEIDPDTWTEDEIEGWLSIGVNRFSIGSQAFSEKYIKLMDRTHLISDVVKTVKYFSERKLNFSVDLMLGLPDSKSRDVLAELDDLLLFNPNHISVYILKARANYPLKLKLPDDESVRLEYLAVCNKLKAYGFDHYEVSNFARDGFYSKHNLQYWNYKSVAGFGPNATGIVIEKEKAIRYQWKSIGVGVSEEVIQDSSLMIEKIFLGLRFKNDFNLSELFSKEKEKKVLEEIIDQWKKVGYIEENSEVSAIKVTSLGYLMNDTLINDVFKYLKF